MEMGRTAVEFFIYNFQTGENQSVGHVSDFVLKGRSNVMIDDILYFISAHIVITILKMFCML